MLNRKDYEARYRIFDRFALNDQRKYYTNKTDLFRSARRQVSFIRATMALFTGIATAAAAVLASKAYGESCANTSMQSIGAAAPFSDLAYCGTLRMFVGFLVAASIILPAIAGFFGALQSIYQWDRSVQIYKDALDNLEVADAQLGSHTGRISDNRFMEAYVAYTEGTLEVMASETSQWGQSIKTPAQIEAFVDRQIKRAQTVQRGITGEGGKEFDDPTK